MESLDTLSFEVLCDRYEACYVRREEATRALQRFEGVIGVGIGPRECNGRLVPEQPCFIVYVNEKKPGSELQANQFIPREFAGIKTDVVAVGSRSVPAHNEIDARWIRLSAPRAGQFRVA